MSSKTTDSGRRDSNENGTGSHLLKVALLTSVPLVLVSVVAGSPGASIMSLPSFGLIFGIEALRKGLGWPSEEKSIRWVGVVLLAPTAFALPTALSMRLDPSVPQTAMVAMTFLLPLITVISYLTLAGLDRWVRMWPAGGRWASLAVAGLLIGGGLPAWVFVQSQIQEARIQEARTTFLEKADTLEERWVREVRATDVAPVGQEALVRSRDSMFLFGPDGTRQRTARLERRGFPFIEAAQLDDDAPVEMITHGKSFNRALHAFDHDGSFLWNYAPPQGTIGSAATTDLDGDNRSEVIAGSMTGGGLQLLSPSGRKLWADTTLSISDVRTFARGLPGSDRSIATKRGTSDLYAATGEAIKGYWGKGRPARSLVNTATLQTDVSQSGFVIGLISDSARASGTGGSSSPSPTPVLVSGAPGPELAAFTLSSEAASGNAERWRRPLPSSSARLAAHGSYLAAVGGNEGRIYIYDLQSGAPVAASPAEEVYRGVEWIASDNSRPDQPPVLLGWTEKELVRLELPESARPRSAGRGSKRDRRTR